MRDAQCALLNTFVRNAFLLINYIMEIVSILAQLEQEIWEKFVKIAKLEIAKIVPLKILAMYVMTNSIC